MSASQNRIRCCISHFKAVVAPIISTVADSVGVRMGELIPSSSGEHLIVAPPNSCSRARQIFSRNGNKNQSPWQLEVKTVDEKWKYLFENQLYTDVMLVSGATEEVLECHRLLLILHSPVFESMLSSRWSRSSSSSSSTKASLTHEELYLPDDDPKIIKLLLENMYNVNKTLSSVSVDDTLEIGRAHV